MKKHPLVVEPVTVLKENSSLKRIFTSLFPSKTLEMCMQNFKKTPFYMAQVIEHLPRKSKTFSLNPNASKKREKSL
jgi:hypothetical protein